MDFKRDDFVMLLTPNGQYRYGYVTETAEEGEHVVICMHEEGESKLAYEQAANRWVGSSSIDWSKALSEREQKILPWLANGLDNKEIARLLNIVPSTVRSHLRVLRIKLGLQDRDQMVVYAQGLDKALNNSKAD